MRDELYIKDREIEEFGNYFEEAADLSDYEDEWDDPENNPAGSI